MVGQQANVDHGEHIGSLFQLGPSQHNDEVLLGFGTQLKCDSLGQLLWNWVLNEPGAILGLAVPDYLRLNIGFNGLSIGLAIGER